MIFDGCRFQTKEDSVRQSLIALTTTLGVACLAMCLGGAFAQDDAADLDRLEFKVGKEIKQHAV